MIYEEYIQSAEWRAVRDQMLSTYGASCEFCGADLEALHVHHLTYERLGCEQPTDLAVLCWSCHEDAHEFPKRSAEIERVVARRRAQFDLARQLGETSEEEE